MNFFYRYKKALYLLAWIIGAAAILPFLINLILGWVLKNVTGIMHVENPDTWVSFLGGFLGAGFTLFAVYWQLESSNQTEKKKGFENTSMCYQLLEMNLENLISFTEKNLKDIENASKCGRDLEIPQSKERAIELSETSQRVWNIFLSAVERLEKDISPPSLENEIFNHLFNNSEHSHKKQLLKIKEKFLSFKRSSLNFFNETSKLRGFDELAKKMTCIKEKIVVQKKILRELKEYSNNI